MRPFSRGSFVVYDAVTAGGMGEVSRSCKEAVHEVVADQSDGGRAASRDERAGGLSRPVRATKTVGRMVVALWHDARQGVPAGWAGFPRCPLARNVGTREEVGRTAEAR